MKRLFRNNKYLVIILMIAVPLLMSCRMQFTTDTSKNHHFISKTKLSTEIFILKHLQKKNGLVATNLTSRKEQYLSESVGLWMEYLLEKNDYKKFDQQVNVLKKHFLTTDYLVVWELNHNKAAPVNALIDDLRIMKSLFAAGEKWGNSEYSDLAKNMGNNLVKYQSVGEYMVDYIDVANKTKAKDVTLSYIMPSAYDALASMEVITESAYKETKKSLLEIPNNNVGFYPKKYDVSQNKYIYDQQINLIDQLYVGYHRSQWNGNVDALVSFLKNAFKNGKLYGQYDLQTGQPIVKYESPAVYALAILMCFEIEDKEFIEQLYKRMKKLQYSNEKSSYNGGYIDIQTKETHTFDNLLALLAERKIVNETPF